MTDRPFIVVSGLPGSGKSTLARELSAQFTLDAIDKDDVLEELFDTRGIGAASRRRLLSREADRVFAERAGHSAGAVLVSHWRLPGMPLDSGTPTDWISRLSKRVAHVRCECPTEVAARRLFDRRRHEGHLDAGRTFSEVLSSIERLASLERLTLEPMIEVDTTGDPDVLHVVAQVRAAWGGT